jgi:hypothetical protein
MTPVHDRHDGHLDVPVITTRGLGSEPTAATFSLERYSTASGIWVYVGDGEDQRVELSLESARRLIDALGQLVEP